MKTRILLLLLLANMAVIPKLFSQNVSINTTGNPADTSAMLDVSSTTKGFLPPRMTTAQQNAIILPATGLAVYNTTLNSLMVNTGTASSPLWSTLIMAIDTTNIASFSQKVRSLVSPGTGIGYNSASGMITNTGVTSLNGNTGALTLDTSYIAGFSQKVKSLTSSTAPITNTNGTIGITQANAATNGYLSIADWNTFNSKGSISSVSVVTNNGVSGVVANPTTTPAIVLTLGAITPSSVSATGTLAGSNLSGSNSGDVTVGTPNGLSLAGQSLSLATAGSSTAGALSSADWNTFNNKANTFGSGNLTEAGSGVLTITGGTGSVMGSGTTVQVKQANTTTNGFLSSTDWNSFNGKGGVSSVSVITGNGVSGIVTNPTSTPAITLTLGSITPTAVTASGTVTGSNLSGTNSGDVTIGTANGLSVAGQSLSMTTAGTSTTGALSSVDWNTFNNKANASNISGTINYVPKFTTSGAVGNSALQDNGIVVTTPELVKYNANYGGSFDARTLVDKNYVDSVQNFISTSVKDTFTSNITVTSLNGLGKYATNAVIPSIGKTASQVLMDALTQVIAPAYTAPTASVNSVPGGGIVEIGSNISVTLGSTYTQNDGGASTGTLYYMGASPLGSNTSSVSNVTSPVTYKVVISYAQGNCKLNNQGVTDCSGRITAGAATSGTITFTPMAQRYWGRSTGVPSSATIIAASSSGGGSELVNSRTKTGFSVTASGSNNIYFAYPSALGDLTAITIGGFDSYPAFTKNIVSFTNASGYTQNYNVYVSNNTLSGDATNINIQ
jgi:hypothetical protein